MSERKPETVHNIPVWGVFLLFLGTVFLLQTLDILPWGLWATLCRFWPVLIIAVGIGILLRRYNTWLISALIMVLFLACLGIAVWQYGPSTPPGQTTKNFSEPMGNLESAQIEIDFNAGSLSMSSLQPGSSNFAEVASAIKDGSEGIRAYFYRRDSTGTFTLSTERTERRYWKESDWEARFTRIIPLTIDVRSAVSNIDLDLRELEVTELRMDIDAGNYIVRMPSSAGTTRAYIRADVSNVVIIIPDGVAARLKANVNLAALEVDERRFPKNGAYYISDDFESAENRIELELDCDIGRVEIR